MRSVLSLVPIERQRLYRQVAEEIKQYILDQGLKKGDALPTEVEFAERLGVSRPTVREALKGLQMVGILTSRKGSGHAVGSLDLLELARQLSFHVQTEGMDFRELAETRLFLEVNILPLVAARATEEDFSRLQQALDLLYRGLEQRDQAVCIAADVAFHRALFEASQNQLLTNLADVIAEFFGHIRRALFTPEQDPPSAQPERAIHANRAFRDHQAICDALRKKDVRRAREVMYDHLSVTCPPEVMAGGLRTFVGLGPGEDGLKRSLSKPSDRKLFNSLRILIGAIGV
ncbi:MAG: FadR family transcriptional regulator [Candidatus Latescibacteria bacterium]|nr:FadR family transcriptional regulator [Candidatus Latescibacterota bacterium]